MKLLILLTVGAGLLEVSVNAFPSKLIPHVVGLLDDTFESIGRKEKRQTTFDPSAQLVSTTGPHAWLAPNLAAGDQRGPCPGLNALANHGYLPHNGVADIPTIVEAVNTGEDFIPILRMITDMARSLRDES